MAYIPGELQTSLLFFPSVGKLIFSLLPMLLNGVLLVWFDAVNALLYMFSVSSSVSLNKYGIVLVVVFSINTANSSFAFNNNKQFVNIERYSVST